MTTAEQMIQSGIQKGMEVGAKLAVQEYNLALVKNMRKLRYESELIAKITNLSTEEVEALIRQQ